MGTLQMPILAQSLTKGPGPAAAAVATVVAAAAVAAAVAAAAANPQGRRGQHLQKNSMNYWGDSYHVHDLSLTMHQLVAKHWIIFLSWPKRDR